MEPNFRPARPSDAAHLVVLIDSASRGLVAWLWTTLRSPGQSILEVGRTRILSNTDSPSHYANWTIAEIEGEIAGALTGYWNPEHRDAEEPSDLPAAFRPYLELEAMAAGTWYLMVVSVFPEYRGLGCGTALLGKAQELAHESGANRMSLIVESANVGALKLYHRFGFVEWARRPFVPFPGSCDEGDWILLRKDIA